MPAVASAPAWFLMSASPPQHWYRLVLHPDDPTAFVEDDSRLRAALYDIGLLGEAFEFQGRQFFQAGPRFAELVVFLGCSPLIELERRDDEHGQPRMDAFCHVQLAAPEPAPRLWVGDPAAVPRCPHCRQAIPDWKEQLAQWRADPLGSTWRCPACGGSAGPAQLNWRQAGGVLRGRIELAGIHLYEAVPSDELLACLGQTGHGSWKYFYARP